MKYPLVVIAFIATLHAQTLTCKIVSGTGIDLHQKPWVHATLIVRHTPEKTWAKKGNVKDGYNQCNRWLNGKKTGTVQVSLR